MKYCKDCKHHNQIKNGDFIMRNECRRRGLKYNLVTGVSRYDRHDCEDERDSGWILSRFEGNCGRGGRFFEPKEVMP